METKTIQLEELTQQTESQIIKILIDEVYPEYYNQINCLDTAIQHLKVNFNTSVLESTFLKVVEAWEEIYRKEKHVLFPYLMQLISLKQLADSCKPFKNIKHHYTLLIHYLQELRTQLKDVENTSAHEIVFYTLWQQINYFQQNMIALQIFKDKYLFSQFKNCSGQCKNLSYE